MIKFEHVWKKYDNLDAVKDLSLKIEEGEICVLLGPSGCGKSTTIRMINRLVPASSGDIFVFGKNVNEYPVEELRKDIGYVVQSIGLFPHMSVGANIGAVPKLLRWDKNRIRLRTKEMLEMVGLDMETYIGKYPRELSGGEAQRVGVARALAADPRILLMDEPFGAVDPLNRKRLQSEFLKIQRNLHKTVVFVTHDVEEAIRMGDKIAILNRGVLEECDTPEGLLLRNNNDFIKSFLGKEYAIKILAKYSVSSVMEQVYPEITANNYLYEDENLMSALSHMIEKGTNMMSVRNYEEKVIGCIDIESVVHALREIE